MCWSRSFAGEVQSPPSLEGSEDRIVTYEPKGKNAHIIVVHCDKRKEDYSSGEIYEKNPSLFRRYYLSGEKSYEKAKGENPKPATITFTDKGGYCYYKRILQGYLTCAQKQEAEDLTGIPVTILLDEEKTPDPELETLLDQIDGGELTGRQSNYVRQELSAYWENDFIKHIRPS